LEIGRDALGLPYCRAVHVKNIDMQKMRTLLSNRKLLKRKLIDVENHIRGALRAYGLLIGAVSRGASASASCSSTAIRSSP
jgi:transposase